MTITLPQQDFHSSFSAFSGSAHILKQNINYCIYTLDNLGFDSSLERAEPMLNPLSGPFLIEGGRRGDLIALTIVEIVATRNIGISSAGILPEFLLPPQRKAVLGQPIIYWHIANGKCSLILDEKIITSVSIKKSLMIGCLRCTDALSLTAKSSLDVDDSGGNLDFRYVRKGATMFLPVNSDEAMFYLGDVHYSQADGEVGGSGIEIPACVTFSAALITQPSYQKLHLIFRGNIYFFGVSKTIDECFQKAYSSAYEWLIKNNCPERRARLRLGHTSRLNIAKLGQPNVVAVSLSNTPIG